MTQKLIHNSQFQSNKKTKKGFIKKFTFEEQKVNTKKEIDNVAEKIRHTYVTPGSGQDFVYQEKSDEAFDYIAAGYPKLTDDYPFIQAEVKATEKTSQQVADNIIEAKSICIAKLAFIEEIRLKSKKDVTNAKNENEVKLILDDTLKKLYNLT